MRRLSDWFSGPEPLMFVLVTVLGLGAGSSSFLNDPGTFWHARLGRDIWKLGHVPRVDVLTSSRQGAVWVDQAWLFDVGLSALVDRWGWSAAVMSSVLVLAWVYAAFARGLSSQGIGASSSFLATFLAVGVGATHFLVRPHLFTFAGMAWMVLACRDFHLSGGRSKALHWAPLVVAVWANLHGGFLAGPIVVLTAGIGHAVSGPWDPDRSRVVRDFARTFALCVLAALANPYGMGIYEHVIGVLHTTKVTDLIQEYQPPAFGSSENLGPRALDRCDGRSSDVHQGKDESIRPGSDARLASPCVGLDPPSPFVRVCRGAGIGLVARAFRRGTLGIEKALVARSSCHFAYIDGGGWVWCSVRRT